MDKPPKNASSSCVSCARELGCAATGSLFYDAELAPYDFWLGKTSAIGGHEYSFFHSEPSEIPAVTTAGYWRSSPWSSCDGPPTPASCTKVTPDTRNADVLCAYE